MLAVRRTASEAAQDRVHRHVFWFVFSSLKGMFGLRRSFCLCSHADDVGMRSCRGQSLDAAAEVTRQQRQQQRQNVHTQVVTREFYIRYANNAVPRLGMTIGAWCKRFSAPRPVRFDLHARDNRILPLEGGGQVFFNVNSENTRFQSRSAIARFRKSRHLDLNR